MNQEIRRELQQLLSALCDGELTDAQHRRLEALLDADAACRRQYLEYLDMHARLLERRRLGQVAPAARDGLRVVSQNGTHAPEGVPPLPGRRRGVAPLLRYGLVAAATLAASLLIQFAWHAAQTPPGGPGAGPGQEKAELPKYVATLTRTADCVWEDPRAAPQAGARLAAGEMKLRKGVARIHFDTGAELIVEGPARLRVDSGTAATVLRGKVVFRADETTAPFDLHTPSATLVDFGTEYAVAVADDGEEIHVFDGEVKRLPNPSADAAKPEELQAGQARRYGNSPDSPGRPTRLDPQAFVRRLTAPNAPPDPAAGLLAYEGFEYPDAELFRTGKAAGGVGWVGPWKHGLIRPLLEGDKNLHALNVRESLLRPGAAVASAGGSFDYTGFAKYHRRLQTPIRLDEDGVYYVSFLFRQQGPPADPLNALAILFRSTDELAKGKEDPRRRLNIGVGGANQIFTHLGGVGSRTPLPLNYGETYLLVAKIVASKAEADQVFIRVYAPQEPIEREEPAGWTVTGPPLHSDLVFDWLEVHVNSKTRQTLDEIRLGTTWSSVTAPWKRLNEEE